MRLHINKIFIIYIIQWQPLSVSYKWVSFQSNPCSQPGLLLYSLDITSVNIHVIVPHTVYPKKYAHGFVVPCFVVITQSFIMNSHKVFIHIHQGCFAGTGAIVRLPQCQWSKPDGYGKISQCITTTKHSKAKTMCIFLGIYCRTFNQVVWEARLIFSPVLAPHLGSLRLTYMNGLSMDLRWYFYCTFLGKWYRRSHTRSRSTYFVSRTVKLPGVHYKNTRKTLLNNDLFCKSQQACQTPKDKC